MEDMITKRNQLRAQQLIQALKQRNMDASYAATRKEALEQALAWIPQGSRIGWGGSVSIDAIGLKDAVRQGDYQVIDRDTAATPEEKDAMMHEILADCDYFLTSTNALSQDGVLVNIDGTANRLAAMCYGPRHVLYIVGMNKVVATAEDALRRARNEAAPTNALRPFSRCLTESVQQAASATVNVCAFVIFFNVVLRLLDCCGLFGLCRRLLAFCHCPDAWQLPLLSGVLELSNGVALLSGTVDGLIPAAFLLSWGGCSVHCQTLTCLTQHDLNLRPYFLGKLFQGCVSAALACLALRFLPLAQRTLNPTQLPLEQPLTGAFGVPLAVSCWLVLGMWALDRWFSGKSTGKRQKKRV